MCSSLLKGTLWDGPKRGRKRKEVTTTQQPKIKIQDLTVSQQPSSYIENLCKEIDSCSNNTITIIPLSDDDSITSEYPRTIYFCSNCKNKEKTYVRTVLPGNYYHCSVCHDYHVVREIA